MITQEADKLPLSDLCSSSHAPLTSRRSLPRTKPSFFKNAKQEVHIHRPIAGGFDSPIWITHWAFIVLLTIRFVHRITRDIFSSKFKLLTKRMFNMIGDKASDFSYYMMRDYFAYYKPQRLTKLQYDFQNTYIQKIEKYSLLKWLMSKSYVFKPESHFLLVWNFYIILSLNFAIFYISAKFSFNLDQRQSEYHTIRENLLYVLPFYSLIVDMFLKLHICYYEKGHLIVERRKIILNYLVTSFPLDAIVILTQIVYLYGEVDNIDLFVLLKIFQIPALSGNLLDRLELTSQHLAIWDLVRLCYIILIEAHFCSCGWFYIGSMDDTNTWIEVSKLGGKDWIEQYFHTFYWSIVTMSTIGYGDIVPQNVRERIFLIFVALISSCTFGYSIGSIGQIFGQLSARSNQIRIDMNNLKKYLRIKGYNQELQIKIRRYFEYVWTDHDDDQFNISNFQKQLPQQLQNEMIIDLHMRSISRIKFLRDNFNQQFLQELAAKFTEERYGAFQTIYSQGSPSQNIFILCEGAVEFYKEVPQGSNHHVPYKKLQSLNKENEDLIFGHMDFFLDRNHQSSCRSTTTTRVIYITRNEFQEIAKKHGYEQYCELKDKLKFSGRLDALNIKCDGCSKASHILDNCPMITGFPNRSKVLIQHRKAITNERERFKRHSDQRRINTLKSENEITDSIIFYLLNDANNFQQLQEDYRMEPIKFSAQQRQIPTRSLSNKKRLSKFQFKPMKSLMNGLKKSETLQQIICLGEQYKQSMNELTETEENQIQLSLEKQIKFQYLKPNYAESISYGELIKQASAEKSKKSSVVSLSSSLESSVRLQDEKKGHQNQQEPQTDQTTSDQIPQVQSEMLFQISPNAGLYTTHHRDIFEEFEKMQDFEHYMPHMNLRSILEKADQNLEKKKFHSFLHANMQNKKRMQSSRYMLQLTMLKSHTNQAQQYQEQL